MEQRFSFPPSASEQHPANEAAHLAMTQSEPRQTIIYRLPQIFPAAQRGHSGLGGIRPDNAGADGLTAGRVLFHLFLLGLTAITTGLVGLMVFGSFGTGIIYALALVTILLAHELGHYIACRWHGVQATLPYFIPFFIPLPALQAGTFGAFIKIKSPIPSRRALFDIGIAGPLAGFAFIIPAAFIAHYFAQLAPPSTADTIYLQDPLLFKFFQRVLHLPADLALNPLTWAAWVGALMTSLNLLPVGQLDGGHVTYAVFGARGHKTVSIGCYLLVIALAIYGALHGTWNWVVWLVLLTFMIRAGHPPVIDEKEPLGMARVIVAIIGLLTFLLCFMPVPISF